MTPDPSNPNFSFLAEFASAMKYAEKADQQSRHGSTLAEYEQARRMAEFMAALENDPVMEGKIGGVLPPVQVIAVRDLPENAGIALIMAYRGREHRVTVSFDDLHALGNLNPGDEAKVDRWRRQVKSSATLIQPPTPVRAQATSRSKASKTKLAP